MKDYTLSELDENITLLFERVKSQDDKESPIESATICFYEYESVMNELKTANIVCSIIIGRLICKYSKRIFIGQYNLVKKAAEEAVIMIDELDLFHEEQNKLLIWANDLLNKLTYIEIEHNPNAK